MLIISPKSMFMILLAGKILKSTADRQPVTSIALTNQFNNLHVQYSSYVQDSNNTPINKSECVHLQSQLKGFGFFIQNSSNNET